MLICVNTSITTSLGENSSPTECRTGLGFTQNLKKNVWLMPYLRRYIYINTYTRAYIDINTYSNMPIGLFICFLRSFVCLFVSLLVSAFYIFSVHFVSSCVRSFLPSFRSFFVYAVIFVYFPFCSLCAVLSFFFFLFVSFASLCLLCLLVAWLIGWFTRWLINWFFDSLFICWCVCVIVWSRVCLFVYSLIRLFVFLYVCLSVSPSVCPSVWMHAYMNRVAPNTPGTRGVNWLNIGAKYPIHPRCGYSLRWVGATLIHSLTKQVTVETELPCL